MTDFQKLIEGFRKNANKPVHDTYALSAAVKAEYDSIEASWRLEKKRGVPVVREPYIEKIPQGSGFREKHRFSMKEKDYAKQLFLLEDSAESYMQDYPELFGPMLSERSMQSKTKERFPDLDLNNPQDIERHRLHVKMYYQQMYLEKRDRILSKIMTIQKAKKERGLDLDVTDITANGFNPSQKAHLVLGVASKPADPGFHPAVKQVI